MVVGSEDAAGVLEHGIEHAGENGPEYALPGYLARTWVGC